jgi:VWFA-related protein
MMNLATGRLVVVSLLIFALGIVGPTPSQADGEIEVTIHSVDDSTSPASAVVTVIDSAKRPVAGLLAEHIKLEDGGKAARVLSVERAVDSQVGISVVLAIQTSANMRASLPQVTEAAKLLIESLAPRDQGAIISFASEVRIEQAMTSDHRALAAALDRLQPGGNTVLYDAVVRSVEEASAAPLPRKVVILLTNAGGEGQISKATRETALGAARTGAVSVYALGFGSVVDRQFLEQLAQQGRGQALIAPTLSEVAKAYSDLGDLLRSQYIVRFEPGQASTQPERQLRLSVTQGSNSGSAVFAYKTNRILPTPATLVPSNTEPLVVENAPTVEDGNNNLLFALVAFAVVVFGGGGVVYLRSRPSQVILGEVPLLGAVTLLPSEGDELGEPRAAPKARLRFEASGEDLAIDGQITLGVDSESEFRLPLSSREFGAGQVRIWFANQRYLLHDTSPRSRVKVNGLSATWSVLSDGDAIDIQGVKLRFFDSRGT